MNTPRLNQDQVNRFREEGYIRYQQPVFSPEKFNTLRERFEELLDAQKKGGRRPEGMDKPHFLHPDLFEWILDDAVLDLVEPILGPDFHVFVTHFICKPTSAAFTTHA